MRRRAWVLLLTVALAAACSSPPDGPQQVRLHPRTPASGLGYVVRLPPGYDQHPGRRYPTIVFLHGAGEVGPGSRTALHKVLGAGLPRLAEQDELPEQAQPFLILAPQTGADWDPRQLESWLRTTLPHYRADPDRLYLTGLSIGGGGVVAYVDAYGPRHRFAAVVPIAQDWAPEPAPLALPSCAHFAGTPMWAFAGQLDEIVPHQMSINLVAYVNGHCRPRERLELTLFLSTFHSAWDKTYDLSGMEPGATDPDWDAYRTDVYTWLLRHRLADPAR